MLAANAIYRHMSHLSISSKPTYPPKFDLGDPKILSLLNHYLYKEILQLEVSVPEGFLIPALGIRHVYCDIIDSITESEDQLIEIGTGASAALAIYLQRNIIEML